MVIGASVDFELASSTGVKVGRWLELQVTNGSKAPDLPVVSFRLTVVTRISGLGDTCMVTGEAIG